jgi:hypothetical protein
MLYFDPHHPPLVVWIDAVSGAVLAEVPVIEA